MKKLVLCADDFGLHAGVSSGIVELAHAGRISATSVMTLAPNWRGDAVALRPLQGRIDVGLHLDWTSSFAIKAGHGAPLSVVMRRAWLGGLSRARSVIERQLDAFEDVWGAPPDHVDGHQHVQQFNGVRQALVAVLDQRYGLGNAKPYLRLSRPVGWQGGIKGTVIAAMGAAALARDARRQGLSVSSHLSGIDDFRGDLAAYSQQMAMWLQSTPERALIMCHPANAVDADDEIAQARLREWRYLMSPDFSQALVQAQVQLVRGGVLYRQVA
jgi:predicted glycoside hydrolase/deacetylase ChbG (UPF0249 family)